ncbi:MAG TPA: hypothetical protein PK504_08525 [Ferruginibacter sp.]|nr:hypothetical protein [Ferruginibacter sp.]
MYSRYENNQKQVYLNHFFVQKVAEEFKVSPKWLISNEDTNINFNEGSISSGATGIGQVENYFGHSTDVLNVLNNLQITLKTLLEKLGYLRI